MFNRIFVEKTIINTQKVQSILEKFKGLDIKLIDDAEKTFSSIKKPYLQKRNHLNLYLGHKKGTLLKEAPDAYGLMDGKHYYFIHAYNCIYECEYCYLQGYFHNPDIVLFLNYDDIGKNIIEISSLSDEKVWFHAGEFSDSLALSSITNEIDFYFDLFSKIPNAFLELRTKSSNIKSLLQQTPIPNVITSFSISSQMRAKKTDIGTPPIKARVNSIKKLQEAGHPVAIHLDPIILSKNIIEDYQLLFEELKENINLKAIEYLSLGVVRFTEEVFKEVQKNYPLTDILSSSLIKTQDNLYRYPVPIRNWILGKVKDMAICAGFNPETIYMCME